MGATTQIASCAPMERLRSEKTFDWVLKSVSRFELIFVLGGN
jgi:hypothetical protein